MRSVLQNSSTVFHFWANKVQPSGRAGNVRFDGDKLYSYAACIACHLPDGSVAISSNSWSATTNRHQCGALSAASHLNIISVGYPESLYYSRRAAEEKIEIWLVRASKARKYKDQYIAYAVREADQFNAFAKALRNGAPLEAGEVEWRIDSAAIAGQDLSAIRARVKAEEAAAEAKRKEREELARIAKAEAISEWRAGDPNARPWQFAGVTVLRLKDDEVQTSRGASIPVNHARRVWPLILRVVRNGHDYTPGDKTVHLGVYQLSRIRADGSIVVGCHDIPFAEIEHIARQLGLIEEEVTA